MSVTHVGQVVVLMMGQEGSRALALLIMKRRTWRTNRQEEL